MSTYKQLKKEAEQKKIGPAVNQLKNRWNKCRSATYKNIKDTVGEDKLLDVEWYGILALLDMLVMAVDEKVDVYKNIKEMVNQRLEEDDNNNKLDFGILTAVTERRDDSNFTYSISAPVDAREFFATPGTPERIIETNPVTPPPTIPGVAATNPFVQAGRRAGRTTAAAALAAAHSAEADMAEAQRLALIQAVEQEIQIVRQQEIDNELIREIHMGREFEQDRQHEAIEQAREEILQSINDVMVPRVEVDDDNNS